MADATPGSWHLDAFLTNILIGYRPTGLIADRIFPVVSVNKQTGAFAAVDRDNWWRRPGRTERAPGDEPRYVGFTVSSAQYNCRNYALGTFQPYENLDNADAPFTPMQFSGQFLEDQLMLDFELRMRDVAITNVGTTIAATVAWDNFGGSDPLSEIDTAIKAVRARTGRRPNKGVMDHDLWLKLRRHPDLVRAVFTGAGVGGIITPAQFGAVIGVPEIIISEGIQITSPEGQPNTYSSIWSTYLLLAYVTPAPAIMEPTYGYAFRWKGPNIGAGGPGNFEMYTNDNRKAGRIDVQTGYYQDERVVDGQLAALITTGLT